MVLVTGTVPGFGFGFGFATTVTTAPREFKPGRVFAYAQVRRSRNRMEDVMNSLAGKPQPRRILLPLTALVLVMSAPVTAVVPVDQGQGFVERPINTGRGIDQRPAFAGGNGFFEGHTGGDGQLWVLDRMTGRVRSCQPAAEAGQPPLCSPWSR